MGSEVILQRSGAQLLHLDKRGIAYSRYTREKPGEERDQSPANTRILRHASSESQSK